MKVKELSIGYLYSKKIEQLVVEIPTLDLEATADIYMDAYQKDSDSPKMLVQTATMARILRYLESDFGIPSSYEVRHYLGKTRTYKQYNGQTATEHVKSFCRLVQYSPKNLAQTVRLVNTLNQYTSSFSVGKNNIVKMFVSEDCFIQNLIKSDLPSEWEKLNAYKFSLVVKRRKIEEVEAKLDGK